MSQFLISQVIIFFNLIIFNSRRKENNGRSNYFIFGTDRATKLLESVTDNQRDKRTETINEISATPFPEPINLLLLCSQRKTDLNCLIACNTFSKLDEKQISLTDKAEQGVKISTRNISPFDVFAREIDHVSFQHSAGSLPAAP